VAGGVSLAGGAALAIAAAGGGLAVLLPVVFAAVGVSALWLMMATRKALATRTLPASSGREALSGRVGVVRGWAGSAGQVFVDGAIWRARLSWADPPAELAKGDSVVVERVSGLTLSVRRAEEWEESW
jgi:membrane-bound serine protease (ClpP class)